MKTALHKYTFRGLILFTLLVSSGPAMADHVDIVAARHTDVYYHTFRAGDVAAVTVLGDGATDLNLYIYDEKNRIVAKDDDKTDACFAAWVPRKTGQYRIEIKNRGRLTNLYNMRTS